MDRERDPRQVGRHGRLVDAGRDVNGGGVRKQSPQAPAVEIGFASRLAEVSRPACAEGEPPLIGAECDLLPTAAGSPDQEAKTIGGPQETIHGPGYELAGKATGIDHPDPGAGSAAGLAGDEGDQSTQRPHWTGREREPGRG